MDKQPGLESMSNLFQYCSGPEDAEIVIVGESWGSTEAREQRPFVGASGEILNKILAQANLNRDQILCTNIIDVQPPQNKLTNFFHPTRDARATGIPAVRGLYPGERVLHGIGKLHEQISVHPRKLVIALGNYPLWALTEDCFSIADKEGYKVPSGITAWRGSQLYVGDRNVVASATVGGEMYQSGGAIPGENTSSHGPDMGMGTVALMPTYHPAALLRKWDWRPALLHDIRNRAQLALTDSWSPPEYNFVIRPTFEQVTHVLDHLVHDLSLGYTKVLSVDLETRGPHIACVGIGESKTDAICIPLMCVGGTKSYWSIDEEFIIIKLLRQIFSHKNAQIIGQNFLYDMQYIKREWDVIAKPYGDTMVMQHLCWPGTPKGLAYISSMYCSYHRYWKDEGKTWDEGVPEDQLWTYNCKDCVTTYESYMELEKLIHHLGFERQMDLQMRQVSMIFNMIHRGVKVDTKRRAETALELVDAINQRIARIEKLLPHSVWERKPKASPWYRSPIQQREIFYDLLGVPVIKDTKTHEPTCNDDAMKKIGEDNPILEPITTIIRELRSLWKSQDVLTAGLDPDKRMRCQFDPTGTVTFRWNSKKNVYGRGCNLQNISKGTEDD